MPRRVRKGDTVVVIRAGDDKREAGEGPARSSPRSDRVVVEGVNLVFKHLRKSPAAPPGGPHPASEAPVHLSNVMPVDPETGTGRRGCRYRAVDGTGVRVGRVTGAAARGRRQGRRPAQGRKE